MELREGSQDHFFETKVFGVFIFSESPLRDANFKPSTRALPQLGAELRTMGFAHPQNDFFRFWSQPKNFGAKLKLMIARFQNGIILPHG